MKVKSLTIAPTGDTYYNFIIQAAIDKLTKSNKPLSEVELIRGIVSNLKQKLKADTRHSAKERFRKDHFKYVIIKDIWNNQIVYTNKKYALRAWDTSTSSNSPSIENYLNLSYEAAEKMTISLLKRMDWKKFEDLIAKVIETKFLYSAIRTEYTNDGGIDIIAEKIDENSTTKNKKKVIYAQVKKFNGTVNRDYADKFIGAVQEHIKNNNWSKFEGLFVTTGKFPETQSFQEKLKRSEITGVSFCCWDGKQLAKILLEVGIGVKYTINTEYWKNLDPALSV